MKPSLTYLKNHLVCLGAAVFLLVSVSAAKAQILLTINISDPSAVTITATDNALTTSASVDASNGVTLLDFFRNIQGSMGTFPLLPDSGSTLVAATSPSGPTLDSFTNDNISNTGEVPDLTLFSGTSSTITFDSGSAAFSGVATLNLASVASNLPAVGDSGTIVTSYSLSPPNTPIGTWEVVGATSAPEPSTWALLAGSVLLFAVLRRRARITAQGAPSRS